MNPSHIFAFGNLPIRLAALVLTAALAALGLASCGHEPEVATPPADYGQTQNEGTANDDVADEADEASSDQSTDAQDQTAEDEAAAQEEKPEAQPAHEGPYVISILNAGGADGLAGAAQNALVDEGIEGDDYRISLDSYLGGTIPQTTVYVTGKGDDAEAVRAEADKVAKALDAEVKTFDAADFVDGTTMDDIDILVLVGANAV